MRVADQQCVNNFGFVRKTGILMPISSLPSRYGIGTFGAPCRKFVDMLAECRQTCWQVLPLNPTAYGNSPYQSPAAMAGNPYFIDPDDLAEQGLLTRQELIAARAPQGSVDYGWLWNTRYQLLRTAYARFTPTPTYYYFRHNNAYWLDDYALFMALKTHYDHAPWATWAAEHRDYAKAKQQARRFAKEINFWCWVQFTFARQWQAVLHYAHDKGIRLIGDMPIYVAYDSVDVWSNPSQYLLDEDLNPTVVAGCPPDYFSADGQMWGNPIYDWAAMQQDGFGWWIGRVRRGMDMYDLLRIDHFRGFAGYYAIPYGDTTARNGQWHQGVGAALFDAIRAELPAAKIIAEDLGTLTEDVYELLRYTGLPGMKVLHFAFDSPDSMYLPRMYDTNNCVVYTGSHDSDTTYGWVHKLVGEARARWLAECPRRGLSATYATIRLALSSRANLCIIPMQDYLELDSDARINTPSLPDGNWTWRASSHYITPALKRRITQLTVATHRAKRAPNRLE